MLNNHDIGGMLAFGAVPRGPKPKLEFENLAFGLTLAAIANGFLRNADENRYAKERIHPAAYLNCSYYERWLAGLEMNLVENGVLSLSDIKRLTDDIMNGAERVQGFTEAPGLAETLQGMIFHSAHSPATSDDPVPALSVGDTVRTKVGASRRHSRLPTYAAGRIGHVEAILGLHTVPDVVAHEDSTTREWTYRIRFTARELWGAQAASGDSVTVDVWNSYVTKEGTA